MIPMLFVYNIFSVSILALTTTSIIVNCKAKQKVEKQKSVIKPAPTESPKTNEAKPPEPSKEGVSKEEKKEKEKEEPRSGKKEKQEDTFDKLQPKAQEAKRKDEIGGKKAENKGDYKTWNKVIENSEFNKTLSDKDKKDEKKKKDGDDKKEDDKKDSDKRDKK